MAMALAISLVSGQKIIEDDSWLHIEGKHTLLILTLLARSFTAKVSFCLHLHSLSLSLTV